MLIGETNDFLPLNWCSNLVFLKNNFNEIQKVFIKDINFNIKFGRGKCQHWKT